MGSVKSRQSQVASEWTWGCQGLSPHLVSEVSLSLPGHWSIPHHPKSGHLVLWATACSRPCSSPCPFLTLPCLSKKPGVLPQRKLMQILERDRDASRRCPGFRGYMDERLDDSRTYRASEASCPHQSLKEIGEQVRDLGASSQGLPGSYQRLPAPYPFWAAGPGGKGG